MKVLFAVSSESISDAIIKKYQKEYKEILSYKNVYYFNAILKEIQKDKTYDRIVISEDLEPFSNNNYDAIDKFIFEKLDNISDEAQDIDGNETSIILICTDRHTKGSSFLVKLFGIGIYNALLGSERSMEQVCKLINKPRVKKEAKLYYKIDSEDVNYSNKNEKEVSELEIQNILTHFKKLGKNTDKYADSFNNIASQYTNDQLKIIINCLPISVKAVLEEDCPKYQELMSVDGMIQRVNRESLKTKEAQKQTGIKIDIIENVNHNKMSGPIVIPSSVRTSKNKGPAPVRPMGKELEIPTSKKEDSQSKKVVKRVEKPKEIESTRKASAEINAAKLEAKREEPSKVLSENTTMKKPNSINEVAKQVGVDTVKSQKIASEELAAKKKELARKKLLKQNKEVSKTENGKEKVKVIGIDAEGNKIVKKIVKTPEGNKVVKAVIKSKKTQNKKIDESENKSKEKKPIKKVEEDDELTLPGLGDDFDNLPEKEVLPIVDNNIEEEQDDIALPGLEDNEEDVTLPGLNEEMQEDTDILPGLDSEDESENMELPGLDNDSDDTSDDMLPGLDDDSDDTSDDMLPGLDDDFDDTSDDMLPGLDDDSDDTSDDMLPGLDDDFDDTSDDMLPGLDDDFDDTSDDMLPGLDDDFDDTSDDTLPGLDDISEDSQENEYTDEVSVPGLDELDELDNISADDNFSSDDDLLPGIEADDNMIDDSLLGIDDEAQEETEKQASYSQNSAGIESIKPQVDYSMSNLNSLLTKDKKIVTFLGTTKNGTSFLVNNLAALFSSCGISTAILDMTKNKNSYYIYTNNEEELRNIAYNSISKLQKGFAEGIKVNKNLTVYTALPNDGKDYSDAEPILSTLVQNHSLILIDCDFETDPSYFASCQEIYLVQSMDILTIQPLTAFLRDLKAKGVLESEKVRVVINKEIKVKSLNTKAIIGGMSFYNDPSMSFMTELFNKDMVKACSIPFEENAYSKYLDAMVNCNVSINGYSKAFLSKLKNLGDMVYPLVSKSTYGKAMPQQNNYGKNNFSSNMNNTLNQMKRKF
ncbi:MAG TPA: hypothetical protein IAD08_04390 [Candidatus Scatovivens faecipullorum]|nr:hypothetical protein [Candidatus Scatovivens faecipullorum]